MSRNRIQLFDKKENCCGCGTCALVCAKGAIRMEPRELGCLYPVIDDTLCVECGMCKNVCAYQNNTKKAETEMGVFAAMAENTELLLKSASGGVFATIAEKFLENGGIVYGCSMEYEEQELVPCHIRVECKDELYKLQGSKYVQSFLGDTFKRIKEDLKAQTLVLFSGTPCQVDALKKYLGREDTSLLYTIDIICHGVPSSKMFGDYIKSIEKKERGKITEFYFRDKTWGCGLNAKYVLINKNEKQKIEKFSADTSSYYSLFLESEIYRESCYSCKYASDFRIGDITIGDFWCVEKEHPEYMIENGGVLSKTDGVSCILVNTEQGKDLVDRFSKGLKCEHSEFSKVAKWNRQLTQASKCSEKRSRIIENYEKKGYKSVEKLFRKSIGIKYYVRVLRNRRRQCRKVKETNIS